MCSNNKKTQGKNFASAFLGWKMGLATTQTKFAPLNAFPYCSPQGHFHITAQEVVTQSFVFIASL
jgi:hypothetical protein